MVVVKWLTVKSKLKTTTFQNQPATIFNSTANIHTTGLNILPCPLISDGLAKERI